jgi:hypothetical protein
VCYFYYNLLNCGFDLDVAPDPRQFESQMQHDTGLCVNPSEDAEPSGR